MNKLLLLFSITFLIGIHSTLYAQKTETPVSKKAVNTTAVPIQNTETASPKSDVKSKGKKERSKKKTISGAAVPTAMPAASPSKPSPQKTTNQAFEPTGSIKEDYNSIGKVAEEVVQQKTNGQVNWTKQFVEAKGQAVIDTERFPNAAQARAMATRGAVVVAQRNLLEIVKGVNVVGETTVQDMATTSDYIYTRVEGLVKGAEQVGQAREVNGMMEVTLKMPLYGKAGVASAIGEGDILQAQKRMGLGTTSEETTETSPKSATASEELVDGSKPVVFTFKGQKIDPSMFPVIVDEKGDVKLDFSKYYDSNSGRFPEYLQLSKEIMKDLGLKKGIDVIELVQNSNGQFTIPQNSKRKAVWQKIGKVAQSVGKILFSLI